MSSELVSLQAYIDGEWCDAASGRRMVSINPATEEAWCDFPDCQEEDVDRAVRAAHRAFTEGPWSTTTPVERGRILKAIAAALPEHNERLARLEVSDSGKIFTESTGFQKFCANFFMFYGELADKAVGHTFSVPFPGIQSYTHRVPMGVVAAVIPWNNPLWLLSLKLGPALAAGNTIVIKTSELCSAPLLEFMKIVEEVVEIPPGVVNFVTGTGEPCGRVLTSHPLVSKIAFTGGPATARRIASRVAASACPCIQPRTRSTVPVNSRRACHNNTAVDRAATQTRSRRPSSGRARGAMIATLPYCRPFAMVTSRAAVSNVSAPARMR